MFFTTYLMIKYDADDLKFTLNYTFNYNDQLQYQV